MRYRSIELRFTDLSQIMMKERIPCEVRTNQNEEVGKTCEGRAMVTLISV